MLERIKGHLMLSRISNAPTILTNVLVGVALATAMFPGQTAIIMLSCVLYYVAGMYLNDVFDLRHDKKHQKHRPLVKGLVTKREAVITLSIYFVLANGLLLLTHIRAFVFGLLLTGCIVLYDWKHKNNMFSVITMGICRVLVYGVAFFSFSSYPTDYFILAGVLLFIYIATLSLSAKHEKKKTLWPTITRLIPLIPLFFAAKHTSTALIAIGYVIWLYIQRNQRNNIALLLAGISLLDAMLLYMIIGDIGFLLGVIGFALTLIMQKHVRGT